MKKEIAESVDDKKALDAIMSRASDLETEVSRLQHDLISTMSENEEARGELKRVKNEIDVLKQSVIEKDEKIERIEKEKVSLEKRIDEIVNESKTEKRIDLGIIVAAAARVVVVVMMMMMMEEDGGSDEEKVVEDGGDEEMNFNILPEGCISSILSLTSPRDACKASLVSTVFKSAAESDAVWERFLPSNYCDILLSGGTCPTSSALLLLRGGATSGFSSKKHLYCSLSDNPILIDGGTKSFSLEKWSGKKCVMLGAKELSIVWGDTPKYWRWRPFSDSRFAEVAELLSVCWLEIHGKMETRMLSQKTTYGAYLVIKFVEGAYGFDHPPAEASIKLIGGGEGGGERTVYLDPDGSQRRQLQAAPHRLGLIRRRFGHIVRPAQSLSRLEGQFPRERGDGWLEIEMGEFFNNGEDGEVQMTLTEVKGGHWKSGLIIQGIELRPKERK